MSSFEIPHFPSNTTFIFFPHIGLRTWYVIVSNIFWSKGPWVNGADCSCTTWVLRTISKATKGKYKGTKYHHTDAFQVQVSFQGPTYMEITQSRAYDAQSLVGNAGGYVGLFLGVALIQTPAAICMAARLLRKIIHKLWIK